jgi:hypothetical protein
VSNAFGTHLGYGVALGKRLHWIPVGVEQDLSALTGPKAEEERQEWLERERLSRALVERLAAGDAGAGAVVELLNPYWGFDAVYSPRGVQHLLTCPSRD